MPVRQLTDCRFAIYNIVTLFCNVRTEAPKLVGQATRPMKGVGMGCRVRGRLGGRAESRGKVEGAEGEAVQKKWGVEAEAYAGMCLHAY